MTHNVCFSGGAKGADVAWGIAAEQAGHDVIHFSFAGHKAGTTENLHELTIDELLRANDHVKRACKSLNRPYQPNKPWFKLLQRNWYQINQTERVYAITEIQPLANSRSCVKGGTGYAIEMAIDLGIRDIHVFDQVKGLWYYWCCSHWLADNKPETPYGLWTGIGSRDINDTGLQAIIDLF